MSDETMPTNVVAALARVMAELPGIGRDETSQQGYRYRGIEAITAHAGKLLGKYGVVPIPRVIERAEPTPLTVNGKPWTEDHLTIEYRLFGPGGIEDVVIAGPFHALGRDNSDKGINKCMTQAYKYMLLQVLCIGDSKDDADAAPAAEADPQPPAQAGPKAEGWASAEQEAAAHKEVATRLVALPEDHSVRATGRLYRESYGWPMNAGQLGELRALLDDVEALGTTNPVPDPKTPPPAVPAPESGDPEPLPAPDERTTALIAYVEGLKPEEIGDQLNERNAALSGTMDIRRSRLCKLLLAEGWQPEGTVIPGATCEWCNIDATPANPVVDGMHDECRLERDAEGEAPPSLPL